MDTGYVNNSVLSFNTWYTEVQSPVRGYPSESLVIIVQSYCDKTLTWGKVFPSSCLSLFNTCSITGSTATLLRLQTREHDAHLWRCHNKGDFVNYSVIPNTQTEDWYCESQSTFIQLRRVRYHTRSPSFTVKSFVTQRWSSGQESWAPTTVTYFYLIFFLSKSKL